MTQRYERQTVPEYVRQRRAERVWAHQRKRLCLACHERHTRGEGCTPRPAYEGGEWQVQVEDGGWRTAVSAPNGRIAHVYAVEQKLYGTAPVRVLDPEGRVARTYNEGGGDE